MVDQETGICETRAVPNLLKASTFRGPPAKGYIVFGRHGKSFNEMKVKIQIIRKKGILIILNTTDKVNQVSH
jgi:hypothetical protein